MKQPSSEQQGQTEPTPRQKEAVEEYLQEVEVAVEEYLQVEEEVVEYHLRNQQDTTAINYLDKLLTYSQEIGPKPRTL